MGGLLIIFWAVFVGGCLLVDYIYNFHEQSKPKKQSKDGICQPIIQSKGVRIWIYPGKEAMKEKENKLQLLNFSPLSYVKLDGSTYAYQNVGEPVLMRDGWCLVHYAETEDGRYISEVMVYGAALDLAFDK